MQTVKSNRIWNKNFVCVFLSQIGSSLSHFAVNTLVSTYATHLGASSVIMGLLTSMFFGISLAMRPIVGPVTTKVNKRYLLIFVNALGGIVNIGYALFHNIPMFVFFRVLHGVQYSLVGSLNMTIAGESLPEEKLASGMGIFGVGSAVSTAIGPSVGVWLKEYGTKLSGVDLGFTLVFGFAAVVLLLAVIPSAILRTQEFSREQIAQTGAWYKNIISVHALPCSIVMTFLIISYALFNAYMVPFGAERGISGISIFFTVQALVMIAVRPISGSLTDRMGFAKICLPTILVFAASFPVLGMSRTLPMVLVSAALSALGYASAQPALQAMCVQSEPPVRRAVATNTFYVGLDLGFFLGPLLGSLVVDRSSYANMYTLAAIPALLAFVFFALLWPVYRRRRKQLVGEE